MICDICKKSGAVIHIEKHAGGNHTQMKICCQCAGIESLNPEALKGADFQKIISDLAAIYKPDSQPHCEKCGTTAVEYDKTRKVGCGQCYTDLRPVLNLRNWQMSKSLKHIGRTPFKQVFEPVSFDPEVEDVEILEEKLNVSIVAEDFEEAAILRDKIEALRKALS